MLNILNKHLEDKPSSCVVNTWIKSLKGDEQEAFSLLQKNKEKSAENITKHRKSEEVKKHKRKQYI